MTAPWARCPRCERDLYPRLARRTEEGWAHSACPIEAAPFICCPNCHHATDPTATGLCIKCEASERGELGLPDGEWVHDGLILRWREAS